MIVPARVIWTSSRSALAWPKSRILARPPGASSQMFAGLMSRWTSPDRWAAASPEATSRPIRRIRSIEASGPGRASAGARCPGGIPSPGTRRPGLADLVDRDDMVMLDRGGGPGLAHEAGGGLGRGGELGSDHLEGHGAEELGILGEEDEAHAPRADQPADAIMRQPPELVAVAGRSEEGILGAGGGGVRPAGCGRVRGVFTARKSIVGSPPRRARRFAGRQESRETVFLHRTGSRSPRRTSRPSLFSPIGRLCRSRPPGHHRLTTGRVLHPLVDRTLGATQGTRADW